MWEEERYFGAGHCKLLKKMIFWESKRHALTQRKGEGNAVRERTEVERMKHCKSAKERMRGTEKQKEMITEGTVEGRWVITLAVLVLLCPSASKPVSGSSAGAGASSADDE